MNNDFIQTCAYPSTAGDLTVSPNYTGQIDPSCSQVDWDWPYPWTYPIYPNYWGGCTHDMVDKIDLKLSEVNKLCAFAKKDKKIREILNKLAPAIKLEVDFDE